MNCCIRRFFTNIFKASSFSDIHTFTLKFILGVPVLEPPILATTDLILSNTFPTPLNIFVKRTGSPSVRLKVTIKNIPKSVMISPGVRDANVLVTHDEDVKNLMLSFDENFVVGNFTLEVVAAQSNEKGQEKARSMYCTITVLKGLIVI